MTTLRSQDEIRSTAVRLGLPEHPFFMRRTARALDIVNQDKVHSVSDDVFRVDSQWDDKHYHVELNHGNVGCSCPDNRKNPGTLCKHMIAATIYSKQAPAITIIKTTDGNDGDYWRRCWLIALTGVSQTQMTIGNRRTLVYEEPDGRLFCTCGAYYNDCIHKRLVIKTVKSQLKFINECGTEQAKALQDKMNAQLNKSGNNGNGAENVPSQPMKLDIRDPFQESESYDIDQIEGRKNGELAWKLTNGEYVISYQGIMKLAEKHDITFTDGDNSNTKQVIARARLNGNERLSGKLPIPSQETAIELAKRNAARQLLPLPEIKAVEKKAQLESDFDWQTAYTKCVEIVGTKAIVDCIINDLVNWGKLRKDNPSHYDRTEWLLIHDYCQKEASVEHDPSSTNNWSYNSAAFIERCKQAIDEVREEKKSVEANELPPQNGDGNRQIQMDKKFRTWLVETDGTKKEISCRDICETFENKTNPRIVTRLRAGIDSGADLSTVELD